MDRAPDLARLLPHAHAVALRLRAAGAGDALIATALDIAVEAVGPLVDVAQAKLRRLADDRTERRYGERDGIGPGEVQ